MSSFENIKLEDLGLSFMDVSKLVEDESQLDNIDDTGMLFGPTKSQVKSYQSWEGCDGSFFFPYSKKDKLGKISDFITAATLSKKRDELALDQPLLAAAKAKKAKALKEETKGSEPVVEAVDKDMDFTTVEEKGGRINRDKKPQWQNNNKNNWNNKNNNNKDVKEGWQPESKQNKIAQSKKTVARIKFGQSKMVKQLRCNLKDQSIDIGDEWQLVKEFPKQIFDRLPALKPVALETAKECGEVAAYDSVWDRATGKKPKPVKHFEGHSLAEESIYEDSTMMELMEQNVADIYTTDAVAAVLMCSTKSNYSWDIEIKKFDGNIFIDKRQDEPDNILNNTTVCETSLDHQPYDDTSINGIKSLWKEAQKINNTWQNMAQNQDPTKWEQFEGENPFIEDENQVATRMGYVYKVWKIQEANAELGLKEKKICIRCAVHTHNGEKQFMNTYALNEHSFDKSNWRTNIDKSIIAQLSQEVNDNSFRITRYLVQSILSGADFIKFGFFSRKSIDDNKSHVLVATHLVKTLAWAKQLNMNMDKMWCIVKRICEEVENGVPQKQKEGSAPDDSSTGEYILLKDFNKLELRLYKKDQNDSEEEEEDEKE